MPELVATSEIIGAWLGIFLTLCILSFLYKDNPFYKFAEHLFIGVSIGYIIIEQYFQVIDPYLVEKLASFDAGDAEKWIVFLPLILVLMMFVKAVSRRYAWLARFPLAIFVGLYAGFAIKTVQSDLAEPMKTSMQDLDSQKLNINTAPEDDLARLPGMSPALARIVVEQRAQRPLQSLDEIAQLPGVTEGQRVLFWQDRGPMVGLDAKAAVIDGERDWFGVFSEVLLLLGLLASLIYFYFSIEQRGPVGRVSRFGVWILMIGFGASFGYTVQGRISLAIGRAMDVMGDSKHPTLAARIDGSVVAVVCIAIIVAGIVVWELRQRRARPPGSS